MTRRILHICAPASPANGVVSAVGVKNARALLDHIQELVGDTYRVRGKPALIETDLDDTRGGRRDDAARIRDLESALGDDSVAAIIPLRGGSWLARLLPHVDFRLLDGRRAPISVFGFSEITPLINIVGVHPRGRGYYYMTPGFSREGMVDYARRNLRRLSGKRKITGPAAQRFAEQWSKERFADEFTGYWREIIATIEGRGPSRPLVGRLVQGRLPARTQVKVIGGCLSLVTTLATGAFADRVDPRGKWLALEDLSEAPYRIDRFLAHLTLAGWFERCRGILVGDFHDDDRALTKEVLALLPYHLPKNRRVPIIVSRDFGHTWPQAMLAIGGTVMLARHGHGAIRHGWRLTVRQPERNTTD